VQEGPIVVESTLGDISQLIEGIITLENKIIRRRILE
jgi:hypothetical protein